MRFSKLQSTWPMYFVLLASMLFVVGCSGGSSESNTSNNADVIGGEEPDSDDSDLPNDPNDGDLPADPEDGDLPADPDDGDLPADPDDGDLPTDPDVPDDGQAPIALQASAGIDQLAAPSSLITLNGSGSTGEGDLIFSWSQLSGEQVELSVPQSNQVSFTTPSSEGELVFQLTVTDKEGNTDSDSAKVTVIAAQDNQPVANAGTDIFITLGESANLSAAYSVDLGGNIAQYQWQQISHDEDEIITLENDESINQLITPTQLGMVSFELTVIDNEGNTDRDTVNVQINSEDNIAPYVTASIDQWVYAGNQVTLDGRHSVGVDDGLNFTQWTQLSGESVELTDADTNEASFVAPDAIGELIFEIRTRDKTGVMGQDTVSIFVLADESLPPKANAGATQFGVANDTITLNGSASFDSDGTIVSYKWKQQSGSAVTLLNSRSAQAQFSTPDFSGQLIFSLTVTDNQGGGHKDWVSVFVNNELDNQAPVADAGEDKTVLTDTVVQLSAWDSFDDDKSPEHQWLWETQTDEYRAKTGNYSDEDHEYKQLAHPFEPLHVRWQQVSGPKVNLVSENHIRAAFTAPNTAATLVFELIAADELGASSVDRVTINVEQDNTDYGTPLSSENVCSSQSAQCGTVIDGSGNLGFCGTCGIGSMCGGDNTCKSFGSSDYNSRYCELNFAQCGEISDGQDGSIACGSCENGNACVDNLCEPFPASEQISSGPSDNLFLHLPTHLTEQDISPNRFDVSMAGPRYTEEQQISRNILTERSFTTDLADASLGMDQMTLSVKFMASHADLTTPDESAAIDWGYQPTNIANGNIVSSEAITLVNTIDGVQVDFETLEGNTLSIENTQARVQSRSCNHFAVSVGENVNSTFNGYAQSHSLSTNNLKALADSIQLGEYSGKAWDLRIYDRELSAAELKELGGDCDEKMLSLTPSPSIQPRLDADNEEGTYSDTGYVCGVYYCSFWWLGQDDASENYQGHGAKRQTVFIKDELHEFYLLDVGMYRHGDFFEFYNGNGENIKNGAILTDEHDSQIRQSYFYSSNIYCKQDYSLLSVKDCGQHANHEDFHRFQGNIKKLYWGDGGYKPLTESMAQWAADWLGKGMDDRRMTSFTQVPHLPIWTKQDKAWGPDRITQRDEGDLAANRFAPEDMMANGVGGRQYAIYPLWAYLVQEVSGAKFAGKLWNTVDYSHDFTKGLTTLFNDVGLDWRDMYLEAAAHVVTYDHAYSDSYWANEDKYWSYNTNDMVTNSESYFMNHPDIQDAKYAAVYSTQGTQGNWIASRPQISPGNWGHNVIKLDVNKNSNYDIKFRHDKNNLEFSEFRTQVVVYDAIAGTREYISMPVAKHGQVSQISVEAKTGQTLFLVIAQTPSENHDRWTFDFHQYSYQITAQ